MSSRSYLSIGDVLTLLREEFPDVTISKIRFLESQGLVNPERSPSGYRKFFEPDVERLRWVLRQQREHFLPLKVIRDRLAAGDLSDGGVETPAEAAHHNGGVPAPAHATTAVNGAPVVRAPTPNRNADARRSGAKAASVPGRTEAQSEKADNEAMARILADASRRAALIPEVGNDGDRAPLHVVPDPAPASASASTSVAGDGEAAAPGSPSDTAAPVTASAPRSHDAEPARTAGTAAGSPTAQPSGARTEATASAARPPDASSGRAASSRGGAAGDGAAGAPGPEPRAKGATSGRGAGRAAGSGGSPGVDSGQGTVTPPMVTGASLTAEELCAATGLSETELAGLQDFGMVVPVVVAGIATFDEDALTVANLAAAFRKFGIEARHLRLYRNAVDREIGLIEQVIIPLLRQRNPESRQRALDAAEELGTLGQTMRATLLRSALRQHMGG